MIYTPEDFIDYILTTEPDLKQFCSDKKFSEVFSETLNCAKITLEKKSFEDDYGDRSSKEVYNFEYNKGHYLYFDVEVFESWYLQRKRSNKLEELGL